MRTRYKGKWLTCTAYQTRGVPVSAVDDESLNSHMDALVAKAAADAAREAPPLALPGIFEQKKDSKPESG
jgi:hypothetical protein